MAAQAGPDTARRCRPVWSRSRVAAELESLDSMRLQAILLSDAMNHGGRQAGLFRRLPGTPLCRYFRLAQSRAYDRPLSDHRNTSAPTRPRLGSQALELFTAVAPPLDRYGIGRNLQLPSALAVGPRKDILVRRPSPASVSAPVTAIPVSPDPLPSPKRWPNVISLKFVTAICKISYHVSQISIGLVVRLCL